MNAAVILVVAWFHAGTFHVEHAPMASETACRAAARAFLKTDLTTDAVQHGGPGTPRWSHCVALQAVGTDT